MSYLNMSNTQAQQSVRTLHTIDNILRIQDNGEIQGTSENCGQNIVHERQVELENVEAPAYDMVQPRKNARRRRTMYTKKQLNALERVFECAPYPDAPARNFLASDLKITEERIQVWFQNRRAKARKDAPSAAEDMNRLPMLPQLFGAQFGAAAGMQQMMAVQQILHQAYASPFIPQVMMPESMLRWHQ